MASKNLPAKKYTSGQREEKILYFERDNNDTWYIDIAKALSEVNRKAYRQGLYYYVQSVELQDNADGSTVDIYTLPDTWLTKQAWIRGYTHWSEMMDKLDVPAAKYADFKIRMTSLSASLTLEVPHGHGTADEWNRSEFNYNKSEESGAQGTSSIYMCGPNAGSWPNTTGYGLITGYTNTRRNIGDIVEGTDPVPTATAAEDILLLDNQDGHPQSTLQKIDDNDLTPYDHDNFYGVANGDLTRQFRLSTGFGAGRAATMGGFCAPLGLLKVDAACTGTYSVSLKLVPGPYHGVYAERVFDEQ